MDRSLGTLLRALRDSNQQDVSRQVEAIEARLVRFHY